MSINLFAQKVQRVIQESKEMTSEQIRKQKIAEEIGKLKNDYAKSKAQHEKNMSSLNPYSFSLNADKNYLLQRKKDIKAALYSIQENSLKEKAKQIDILSSSIGHKYSYRDALKGRIDKLNENLKKINNQLAGLQKKEGEENTEKIKKEVEISNFNKEMTNLDDEISNLDALLEKSSSSAKQKKTKSLDDFLNESGRTSTTKKSSSNNLDDLLAGNANNKKTTSSNLDDLLSTNNDSKAKGNDLDAMLGSAVEDTDFKIDYKNGLTGVINSRGKILIPYKNWSIVEYKMGIAKVRMNIDETSSTNQCTFNAYKEGFVDNNGGFIDGFEILGEFKTRGLQSLLYLMVDNGETVEETRAKAARIDKRIIKENAVKSKKCELEYNSWISGIKSRNR
tara:strand:- start:8457 stop:9635 length:1179 start_codon:yes stop_codon:yes gene_type:complete